MPNSERDAMPWATLPAVRETSEAATYAVGDRVYSGHCAGTVHAVGDDNSTIAVAWDDGEYGPITYPSDAGYLRKAMPWE